MSGGPILERMSRISRYDKYPVVRVADSSQPCRVGWQAIGAELVAAVRLGKFVLCVECYPGAIEREIENDARMALLGECYAGAAQGETDVVIVTLGTGIGGAVLMNGKVLRGKHILGGNLCGHIPVDFNGRRCTCGAIGCAEAEAGGWSLPLVAAAWPGFAKSALSREPAVSFRSLFEHATQGDGVALAIQERCLRIWATLTTGLIHSFDPDVFVFGAGVLARADVIVPYIQKHVIEYAWTPWGKVRIKPAKLGSRAALLGAIPLLTGGPAAALSD